MANIKSLSFDDLIPKVDATEGMGGMDKFWAGAGAAATAPYYGARQMLGIDSQAEVDERKRLEKPLMDTGAGMAGNVAGNLAMAVVPGIAPVANTVKGSALIGAGLSALQPTATGESRMQNLAIGGALGAGGAVAGKLLGKVQSAAAGRVEKLAEGVKAKAAADAASETLSARSAAGNAAQNAYRQLEHLRELGAMRGLSAEEANVARELAEELATKAQEKLIPAAALKKSTAQAFQDAVASEPERAAAMAAEKLSGGEAKRQAMARLKRYGPAALGGAIGGAMFGSVGSVAGIPIGLYLRPALHSMARLAKNPSVQYNALKPIAGSGLLDDLSNPIVFGLLAPSIYAAKE